MFRYTNLARKELTKNVDDFCLQKYEGSFYNMLKACITQEEASHNSLKVDALELVEKVVSEFPMFRDEAIHPKAGKGESTASRIASKS